uniref:NADH dehydrogenase subunit 3 n=1 Tax=Sirsoe methanicola TaxID=378374 RepID=UPI0020369E06|nr:NADH dehydrogenase subunit 3 [Sirsoe methanicola]UQV94829.1 NADH dehydrogenase subunit 3 [Sirsoe methanicola]
MNLLYISTFIALAIPAALMFLIFMLNSRSMEDREKKSPFECGFDPKNSARLPFSLRFFLLAVIFLVFDIEIVLLMPLPLSLKSNMVSEALFSGTLFLLILVIGLLHEWHEGSLDWGT